MARIRIEGTSGNDTLREATNGESDIFGFGGNDKIFLTRGDDLGGDNFVNAGPGNDKVSNVFEGGNLIRLGSGDDLYVGTGFSAFNQLDRVNGEDGDDTIIVGTLLSTYSGGKGNDTFISEGFRNDFDGGPGTDTINYSLRSESDIVGDQAVTVSLGDQAALTGAQNTESLIDIENVIGTQLSDIIAGDNRKNKLLGKNGNDSIEGFGGKDTIDGGIGDDQLAGDDGNDTLKGGPGLDQFFFRANPGTLNSDIISDFNPAEDRMFLSAPFFPGIPTGTLDASRLAVGPSATNPNQRIIYDRITGKVFFDADGSGATEAKLVVTLPTKPELTAAHFEVFNTF